jgi:hypothetical protein
VPQLRPLRSECGMHTRLLEQFMWQAAVEVLLRNGSRFTRDDETAGPNARAPPTVFSDRQSASGIHRTFVTTGVTKTVTHFPHIFAAALSQVPEVSLTANSPEDYRR